jgi:hypothetical protein
MQLSFWKYSVDALGQYTSVDLLFQSGKRLSGLSAYVDNNGKAMSPAVSRGTIGVWENFTCQIGTGALVGDVITGILIGYDHPATSGTFNAYFDDVIVNDAKAVVTGLGQTDVAVNSFNNSIFYPNPSKAGDTIAVNFTETRNGSFQFRIFNSLGQPLFHATLNGIQNSNHYAIEVPSNLPSGCYYLELINENGKRITQKLLLQND